MQRDDVSDERVAVVVVVVELLLVGERLGEASAAMCVIVSLDDPPGTLPANCTPAQRRRQWNMCVYVVTDVVEAVSFWALLFQLKQERFQGRARYEDPYGVAIYGALVTGLLRVPFNTLLFPAMFPLLFAVNNATEDASVA